MIQHKCYGSSEEINGDSVFYKCMFHGIDFDFWENATFYDCSFTNCNFNGTDGSIIGCSIYGCELYGGDIDGYNNMFEACKFDSSEYYFYNCEFKDCSGQQVPQACPSHGEFIAWKAAMSEETNMPCIVKLLIPADATRSSANDMKCRASKAIVLEIQDATDKEKPLSSQHAYSYWDEDFKYEPGMTVYPEFGFSFNRWNECAGGIHFFVDREGALKYAQGIEY